jgi:hypothetical protein
MEVYAHFCGMFFQCQQADSCHEAAKTAKRQQLSLMGINAAGFT